VTEDNEGRGQKARESENEAKPKIEVVVAVVQSGKTEDPSRNDEALCGECLIYGIATSAPQHKEAKDYQKQRREYLGELNHLRQPRDDLERCGCPTVRRIAALAAHHPS
jgi:hypothetical protein